MIDNDNIVAVIGGGNVGAAVAHYVAQISTGVVRIIDPVPNLAKEKATDYNLAGKQAGYRSSVEGSENLSALKGANLVVHTAGVARKPGMDRLDLLKTNVSIARDVSRAIAEHAPSAIVVVVANPLDVIAMLCYQETGFPKERVIGMAGVLDSARNSSFIAEALGNTGAPLDAEQVQTQVLGGHGDTMVPLPQYAAVSGVPLEKLLGKEQTEQMENRARNGGAEIVNHLKTGSAFYAPAASATKMLRAFLCKERHVLPASVYLSGEYGHSDIFLGVPVILGPTGLEKIVELPLDSSQKEKIQNSVSMVQSGLEQLKNI